MSAMFERPTTTAAKKMRFPVFFIIPSSEYPIPGELTVVVSQPLTVSSEPPSSSESDAVSRDFLLGAVCDEVGVDRRP